MAWTERYVTELGAGLEDGTSEANAWPWATMLTDIVAGERGNVKGSFSVATTSSFTNGGTTSAPMAVRGYSSTIGDLDGLGRTNFGALVSTGFPVITHTNATGNGLSINQANIIVSNIKVITTATTSDTLAFSVNKQGWVFDSVFEQQSNTGELVSCSNASGVINNCDFIQTGTSISTQITVERQLFSYCRFTNPGGAANTLFDLRGQIGGVVNCQILDFAVVFGVFASTGSVIIANNSVRNCNTFLYQTDSDVGLEVHNNIAWGSNAAGSEAYKHSASGMKLFADNAFGNFADADQNFGDWPDIRRVALSADPYTSSSDLRLNSTAGGGTACKAVSVLGGDLGAIQSASGGGGGCGMIGPNGGMIGQGK